VAVAAADSICKQAGGQGWAGGGRWRGKPAALNGGLPA